MNSNQRRATGAGTLLLALLAGLAVVIMLIRRGQIPYSQRAINKRWLNPLMMRFAGQQFFPHAVILHQGRASGRFYTTPIYVEPIIGGFVIPLPYGAQVDWLRNILAAGHATIRWHAVVYEVVAPTVIAVQAPLPGLSPLRRQAFRWLGATQMVVMPVTPVTTLAGKA